VAARSDAANVRGGCAACAFGVGQGRHKLSMHFNDLGIRLRMVSVVCDKLPLHRAATQRCRSGSGYAIFIGETRPRAVDSHPTVVIGIRIA
jgi:hypothetical protein